MITQLNRLMTPKSSYRRSRLAPRCRLIASSSWRRFEGFGCSPMKAVRELGLIRRKTVWILSFSGVKNCENHSLVREDREWQTSNVSVVLPKASLSSYVWNEELLKASQAGIRISKQVFFIVEDYYVIGGMCIHSNMRANPY